MFSEETLQEIATDVAASAAIKISKHVDLDEFLLNRVKTAVLSEVLIAFSGYAEKE